MEELTLHVVTDTARPVLSPAGERAPWRDGDGVICARVYRDAGVRSVDWPDVGLFSVVDGQSTVRAWPAPGRSSSSLEDFFRRRLQPIILQTMGYQTLHASAVLGPSGAVAFCGLSGAGKSTLAYALGAAGFAQIADDAVVIDPRSRPPQVRVLPHLPQLRGQVRELLGHRIVPDQTEPPGPLAPLALLVLIRRDPEGPPRPRLQRLSGPAACVAFLAHAHTFDADADAERLVTDYAAIVDAVPAFTLTYRPALEDLSVLVHAVRSLMADPRAIAGDPVPADSPR